jgi:hypothetical protein
MESNCFIYNDVAGNAVVTMADEPEHPFLNNFGTTSSDLDCQFASVGFLGNSSSPEISIGDSSGRCIDFDANVCPLPFEYEASTSGSENEASTSGSGNSIMAVLCSIGLGILTSAILF